MVTSRDGDRAILLHLDLEDLTFRSVQLLYLYKPFVSAEINVLRWAVGPPTNRYHLKQSLLICTVVSRYLCLQRYVNDKISMFIQQNEMTFRDRNARFPQLQNHLHKVRSVQQLRMILSARGSKNFTRYQLCTFTITSQLLVGRNNRITLLKQTLFNILYNSIVINHVTVQTEF